MTEEKEEVLKDLFKRVEARMNSHVEPKIYHSFKVTEDQNNLIQKDIDVFSKMKVNGEKVVSVSERYIFSHTGIGAALDVEFTLVSEEGTVILLKKDYSDYENW